MKTYGEVEVQFHTILSSTLDGGEKLHAPAALPSGKELLVLIG